MKKAHPKIRRFLKVSCFGCLVMALLLGLLVAWLGKQLMSEPGPVEMTAHHPFRSVEAQERYLERYDRRSAEWPKPSESRMIETSFGQTFVRVNGPADAPPLVLLPGGNATSLIWSPNIADLSASFRTYAVDNIYDFGRSVYTRHVTTPEDFVLWLDQVFDGLALGDDVNLMGLSYGGWIASQYAISRPDRLGGVVLVAPAATVLDFNPDFLMRAALSLIPHRYFVKDVMYWMLEDAVADSDMRRIVDELAEDNYLAMRCFEPRRLVNPTVLSDEQLQGLEVRTLFLVGENEKIYSAQAAIQRLNEVAPEIEAVMIPDAGHDLTLVQAELVDAIILDFLGQDGDPH